MDGQLDGKEDTVRPKRTAELIRRGTASTARRIEERNRTHAQCTRTLRQESRKERMLSKGGDGPLNWLRPQSAQRSGGPGCAPKARAARAKQADKTSNTDTNQHHSNNTNHIYKHHRSHIASTSQSIRRIRLGCRRATPSRAYGMIGIESD